MANRKLTIGDIVYKLGFENEEQFVAALDGLMKDGERKSKVGGEKAGKGWSDSFKGTFRGAALGSFFGTLLSEAFAGAIRAARQFAVDSVREFAVYEQGLLQLKLAGETNLAALSQRIQDTAKATKVFSATDVSVAVGELVKAGYDAETAFALVETGALGAASEVDAASGRFGDLTTTAGQLGNILRALGYDTSQSGRVMDVLARAAQDSNLNVSDLVDIVARVGPTAKLAGLEIEDLAAQAAVLSNNGMDASLIGTGLRSVLQSLINPSAQVKGQLDELGISIVDGNGNLRDFNEVLDGLHELTLRGGEGLQILTQATGAYGSTAAASLGSASETVKEFRANMEDAEGTALELADTMRNSAAGAAAEMEARIRDAKAQLGEQMTPLLISLYETVFPRFIAGLGAIIEKWEQWEFLLTGTTRAIRDSEAALQQSLVANLGPDLADAVNNVVGLRQRVAGLRSDLEEWRHTPSWLPGTKRRVIEDDLEQAEADLAAAERRLEALKMQRGWSFTGTEFGPQLMPDGWTPPPAAAQNVDELTSAYRNLAAIEEELKAARDAFSVASSPQEEAALATRIKQLEAEREAVLGLIRTSREASTASVREVDPIADETRRVTADTRRLKDALDLELITRDDYLTGLEAHQRRLWGVLDRAETPEQRATVLAALRSNGQEIAKIQQENLDRLLAAQLEYQNSRIAQQQAADAEVAAVEERAAARRLRREQRDLQVIAEAWREYYESRMAGIAAAEAEDERKAASAARREASNLQIIADAHKQYTDSLREAAVLEEERAARQAASAARREARDLLVIAEAHQQYVDSLREAQRLQAERERQAAIRGAMDLGLGTTTESVLADMQDRAAGSAVRLAEAQRVLGQATRDDVTAAVEEQIRLIEVLLPHVEAGSDAYYDLVAALQAARASLASLNAEVASNTMPMLTDERSVRAAAAQAQAEIAAIQAQIAAGPDTALLRALEGRLAFLRALLQTLGVALADFDRAAADAAEARGIQQSAEALAGQLVDVAASFPLAIVEGIRAGDIGAALQDALGGAADFFLDTMLDAIMGPIKEQLAAAIAESIATKTAGGAGGLAALGPAGLAVGGIALLASMFLGANQRRQAQSAAGQRDVQRAVSSAPSITYNLSANLRVEPGGAGFGDPAFETRLRAFVQEVATDLYRRVRRES